MRVAMDLSRVAVTIDEAILTFAPPLSYDQLAGLIAALGIRPVGKRQEPRRGRPRLTYNLEELERLHAAVAPWLEASRHQGSVTRGMPVLGLTIDELASLLNPPMTHRQLADLIAALRIQPIGKRRQPRKGRPALTYDAAELMRLHAAVAPWLSPQRSATLRPSRVRHRPPAGP